MKKNFSVSEVRRFMEPGPIVLVSSSWKGQSNIMTMGWHMIMGTEPSLIGCYIWNENYSYHMILKSKECVINVPTIEMATTAVRIGNCHGDEVDKFKTFKLTPVQGKKVGAPLIKECYANFECKLVDTSLIKNYSLFIFEVVKARIATSPKYPKTIHYRGKGIFMVSGDNVTRYRRLFKPEML